MSSRYVDAGLKSETVTDADLVGDAGKRGGVSREVGVDVSPHRLNFFLKLADAAQSLSKLLLKLSESAVVHFGSGVVMPNIYSATPGGNLRWPISDR